MEEKSIPDLSVGYEKFTGEQVYQSFMVIAAQWHNNKH
ncbi:hypothetical protein vfu_A00143 [Vibrio furnissii NCTC 11218]|nr:hypothetical protein vfu_A00143 [Vibrio furnissii NCTC 11218]